MEDEAEPIGAGDDEFLMVFEISWKLFRRLPKDVGYENERVREFRYEKNAPFLERVLFGKEEIIETFQYGKPIIERILFKARFRVVFRFFPRFPPLTFRVCRSWTLTPYFSKLCEFVLNTEELELSVSLLLKEKD